MIAEPFNYNKNNKKRKKISFFRIDFECILKLCRNFSYWTDETNKELQ